MANDRTEMTVIKGEISNEISNMKKEGESTTEKMMTLLFDQNRLLDQHEQLNRRQEQLHTQLIATTVHHVNTSTTQSQRNSTDFNPTAAAAIVTTDTVPGKATKPNQFTELRLHAYLVDNATLFRGQSKRRKIKRKRESS